MFVSLQKELYGLIGHGTSKAHMKLIYIAFESI